MFYFVNLTDDVCEVIKMAAVIMNNLLRKSLNLSSMKLVYKNGAALFHTRYVKL